LARIGREVDRVRSSREVANLTNDEELRQIAKSTQAEKAAIQAKGAAEGDLAKAENVVRKEKLQFTNNLLRAWEFALKMLLLFLNKSLPSGQLLKKSSEMYRIWPR
jgi:hypothetical protein